MKTRILLIVTMCFCLIGGAFAQTNMDLEIWGPTPPLSGSDPTGWGTGNTDQIAGPVSTFQETVNPGQGLSSARMVTTAGYLAIGAPQDIIGGFINSGTSPFLGNMGVPYTQKPTSMDCQFMCNIMPGDTGAVLVQLTHWDGTAQILDGQGIIAFDGTVNAWTPVNVPITYITADTPDTLLIVGISSIEIFFGSPVGIVGSTLYLDDFVLNTGGCPAPTAGFTSTSNLLAATFTDGSTTTGGATYIWDFGDGVGTSTLQNPSYTYLAAGTYNVCLTIVDACGADQICQTITVTGCPTPTAAFSSFDSSLTVIFNDLSTTTGA
ncbi:MAG: PKD domain-containing protein, partial [Flavobacteriales bacterium]|nr:PKD domain-containing protein [Flavobacteriales bacterium]